VHLDCSSKEPNHKCHCSNPKYCSNKQYNFSN